MSRLKPTHVMMHTGTGRLNSHFNINEMTPAQIIKMSHISLESSRSLLSLQLRTVLVKTGIKPGFPTPCTALQCKCVCVPGLPVNSKEMVGGCETTTSNVPQ